MIERSCATCRLNVRDLACARCGSVVHDKPSRLEWLDENVKPPKGIRVDVHRRFVAGRARALKREERERAAIVARIAALPKLIGRQREKMRTEEASDG